MEYIYYNIKVTHPGTTPASSIHLLGMIDMEGYNALSLHVTVRTATGGGPQDLEIWAYEANRYGMPQTSGQAKVTIPSLVLAGGVYLVKLSTSAASNPLGGGRYLELGVRMTQAGDTADVDVIVARPINV